MPFNDFRAALIGLVLALFAPLHASADNNAIIVQSTTSTASSGLYDHLLPLIEKDTGVTANVVAVGTGQAIVNAKNCDGDVLLVHAKDAEEAFVKEGYGVRRFDLMYNDFIIVGPASDPAGIEESATARDAFQKIAASQSLFASRGDDSGTHQKEMSLWAEAGIDVDAASGAWYRSTGSGMGATLNTGIGMDAYVMTDRASWISFKNKADHIILSEGDPEFFNQYGIILIDRTKCPRVKSAAGQAVIDWLLSPDGQSAIAGFRVEGQQLFFPNAEAR